LPANSNEHEQRIFFLVNQLIGFGLARKPRKILPLEYVVQEARKLCEEPTKFQIPSGLDYSAKHAGLREFMRYLVIQVDSTKIDEFIQQSISEHHLVPAFQRALGKFMLPIPLRIPPLRINKYSSERLKNALREVLGDWESLISFTYGFTKMVQKKPKTWSEIREVSLYDKVQVIRKDNHLIGLAKEEWVTIRNSLDHGTAYYNPNTQTIEFPDRKVHCSLTLDQTVKEGQDIFLANVAMLHIINLIKGEQILKIEPWVSKMSAEISEKKNISISNQK